MFLTSAGARPFGVQRLFLGDMHVDLQPARGAPGFHVCGDLDFRTKRQAPATIQGRPSTLPEGPAVVRSGTSSCVVRFCPGIRFDAGPATGPCTTSAAPGTVADCSLPSDAGGIPRSLRSSGDLRLFPPSNQSRECCRGARRPGHPRTSRVLARNPTELGNVLHVHRDTIVFTGTHRRIEEHRDTGRMETEPRRFTNGRFQIETSDSSPFPLASVRFAGSHS